MAEESAAQAAFDLAFLAVLAGQQANEDVLVKKQFGRVSQPGHHKAAANEQLPSHFPSDYA